LLTFGHSGAREVCGKLSTLWWKWRTDLSGKLGNADYAWRASAMICVLFWTRFRLQLAIDGSSEDSVHSDGRR